MGIKQTIRGLVPRWLLERYHWCLAAAAVLYYGFPARKLVVVGVTGTKGKSTTASMIAHIFQTFGHPTALVSTVQFGIKGRYELNTMKMTMPSPFWLQRYLRSAVAAGCTHAVVETSSEGLAQWRHLGIPYAVAVMTNLAPEHIQAHGSYEKYREAKGRLFKAVHKGTAIINLDDKEADYFTSFPAGRRICYTLNKNIPSVPCDILQVRVKEVRSHEATVEFNGVPCRLPVGGLFNIMNATAAFAVAFALKCSPAGIARSLASFPGTPGRLEYIHAGQPFNVVVDYAHTIESLEALYKTLQLDGNIIAVLGATGGGRDKQKRIPMGQVAARYARAVIVTDEDPYDEDPRSIMDAVAQGVRTTGKIEGKGLYMELSRRVAIAKALAMAKTGDTVAISGKGAEQCIMRTLGTKEPWDDRQVVLEELALLGFTLG